MDETFLEAEEKRIALRRVAAYRSLCARVQRSAIGTLFSGGLMLAIWYFAVPPGLQWSPFGTVFFGLAMVELGVGLLNRLFPSAEGVLLEGFLLLAFGGWNVGRQGLIWQAGGRIVPPLLVIGILSFLQGIGRIREYFVLRREFADRPSAEHIRWFDGLAREVRDADPKTDPTALALATVPFLTAKLLGDTAFFTDGAGEVIIVSAEEVELEMHIPDPERPPIGYLTISGVSFEPFKLTKENWENYCAWKGQPAL